MDRLFNPFRYIAGTKSLVLGIIFIISECALLYSGGYLIDGYVHISVRPAGMPLWQTLLTQIAMWLAPALLLYLCGLVMSHSRIRPVDILGTTAFAQILLLPMIAPLLIPSVGDMLNSVAAGAVDTMPSLLILLLGVWSVAWLALFYVWNYNAFSVSCNVRGAKAIAVYVAVTAAVTLAAPYVVLIMR